MKDKETVKYMRNLFSIDFMNGFLTSYFDCVVENDHYIKSARSLIKKNIFLNENAMDLFLLHAISVNYLKNNIKYKGFISSNFIDLLSKKSPFIEPLRKLFLDLYFNLFQSSIEQIQASHFNKLKQEHPDYFDLYLKSAGSFVFCLFDKNKSLRSTTMDILNRSDLSISWFERQYKEEAVSFASLIEPRFLFNQYTNGTDFYTVIEPSLYHQEDSEFITAFQRYIRANDRRYKSLFEIDFSIIFLRFVDGFKNRLSNSDISASGQIKEKFKKDIAQSLSIEFGINKIYPETEIWLDNVCDNIKEYKFIKEAIFKSYLKIISIFNLIFMLKIFSPQNLSECFDLHDKDDIIKYAFDFILSIYKDEVSKIKSPLSDLKPTTPNKHYTVDEYHLAFKSPEQKIITEKLLLFRNIPLSKTNREELIQLLTEHYRELKDEFLTLHKRYEPFYFRN